MVAIVKLAPMSIASRQSPPMPLLIPLNLAGPVPSGLSSRSVVAGHSKSVGKASHIRVVACPGETTGIFIVRNGRIVRLIMP